jgi:steroid 5-alpha reductase family enzyme
MNTLELNLWILAGISLATWLTSVITKEYSWVDRIWSIIPFVYLWVFASHNFADMRLVLMAVVATLWGVRLTFNFARKGGYAKGGEDYRWAILRAKMPPVVYQIFNVLFIVIFQNVLLFLITMPAARVLDSAVPFGLIDIAWASLFLGFLAFEFIADQQQWHFHQLKKAGKVQGFQTRGLFSVSRHPNFFAEQAQWWVLYFWGATVSGEFIGYDLLGVVLLSALFAGSLRFTEKISLGKYPEYAAYQKKVSALIPWFPAKG